MSDETVLIESAENGVVRLILNRPHVLNAMNDTLINDLTSAIARIKLMPGARVLIITGAGECFSTGLDIAWMAEKLGNGTASKEDSRRLAHLLLTVKHLTVPTIAAIDGPCIGGGLALATCCDISVASEESEFSLPAVRLGTAPAIVLPFVVDAIGAHLARRYLLTGETLSAEQAKAVHLVHAVTMRAQLSATVDQFVEHLLQGGPEAITATKEFLIESEGQPLSRGLIEKAASRAVRNRQCAEAREGIAAFIEDRDPEWRKKPE